MLEEHIATREQNDERTQTLLARISELEEQNSNLRLLEQSIKRNFELFNALLYNSSGGITITAPDRRIIRVVRSLGGYMATELSGVRFEAVVHPDDQPIMVETYRRLIELRSGTASFEVRLFNRNGTYRWVGGVATDMLDDPSVQAVVLNYSDISERKEDELAKSELVALVQNSDYAIFSESTDGKILSWNKGAMQMFGHAPQDVLGHHVDMLVPEALRMEEELLREKVCCGAAITEFYTERLHRSGVEVPIYLQLTPILGADGDVRRIAHISRRA